MKAAERAPSAISFLRLFGIANVRFITSAVPEAPKIEEMMAVLRNPSILDKKVEPITMNVDIVLFLMPGSLFILALFRGIVF
jgi:hypothetical protein